MFPRGRRSRENVVSALQELGACVAFSDRRGGSSHAPFDEANVSLSVGDCESDVKANRRRVLRIAGLEGARIATVRQRHTAAVVRVSLEPSSLAPVADGMVTDRRGIALLVGVADCAPVLLVDPGHGVVGALHVGWRGLLSGVVPAGAEAFFRLGGRPSATITLVGPCIGACCYEVSADVQGAVAALAPDARAVTLSGMHALDLRAAVRQALARAGLPPPVEWPECTSCMPQSYFSKRRDGVTGHQAAVVGLLTE